MLEQFWFFVVLVLWFFCSLVFWLFGFIVELNRAGNAINHPENIGPDSHAPGSPLPRAIFVNSVGYLPDGTPLNRAGNAIDHPDPALDIGSARLGPFSLGTMIQGAQNPFPTKRATLIPFTLKIEAYKRRDDDKKKDEDRKKDDDKKKIPTASARLAAALPRLKKLVLGAAITKCRTRAWQDARDGICSLEQALAVNMALQFEKTPRDILPSVSEAGLPEGKDHRSTLKNIIRLCHPDKCKHPEANRAMQILQPLLS
ncbi:Ribulose bisphosphate carboxylase, chloroplastic [Symbiodinium microadriaticum]|uniref:Ribulose bisphosphate carboxylase, chloroplastic n=1 Tax=Symbiodinium microadriaticum TaxID=2951 RepID=A0A1Q9ETL0_SYMMI|nr:Ribulose bisphosphate carboxylase, chloroplastic [Symbiodinium microadriaticum]